MNVPTGKIWLQRDETLKVNDQQEITCNDIGRLAWSIYKKGYFFARRRGLKFDYRRDINGSGEQLLEITREADDQIVFRVIFDVGYRGEESFIYEADLITDQRKDYMPSVNRGKHKFLATRAEMNVEWNGDEVEQWRADVARLSATPETLEGWVEAGQEMMVVCAIGLMCGHSVILTHNDLAAHVAAGLSLEDLQKRLTCTECRHRSARLTVF